ncbi:uncharacterized protein [Apostichopus japonicus]|uniref:uncharacterized protein n=1 Tax=Stichopus japonicus TaxID=307972 RepID=UPI003AB40ADC
MQFQRQGMSPRKPQVVTNVKEMKEDTKEVGESQTRLSDIEEGSETSADQVSIRTGDNMKNDEGDYLSLRAESMIGKDGGTLDIQNTGVSLQIPPGALQRDYFIQMRIIPHHYLDETVLSFARNSSVVVELLPNNVKLLKPAKLTLPHCLVLKKICGWKAKVYSSHHEEGTQPQWKEEINTQCDVTYETCVVRPYNFSWKKVEIGDHIVEAKKIVLFAAQRFSSTNNVTYLDVGYYWQLASCQGVLNLNRVIVLHEIPAVFFKKGQLPLTVLFDKVLPPNWTYNEAEKTKEISFSTVAITEGSFCTFLLNKVASDETYGCSCYFKAGQGSDLVDLIFPLKCEDYYQNLPVGQPLNQQHHCGFKRSRIERDHDHESVSASLPLQRHRNVDMPFQSHTQYQDSDTFRRMPAQHLSTLPQPTTSQRYTAVQDVHSKNKESSLSRTEATLPSMGIATAGGTHEELPSAIAQTEDNAVSEESLQDLSEKLGKCWMDVGRKLQLTEEQLESLEQMGYPTLQEKIYQMLLVWKRKRASAATYVVLADALRKAGRVDLQEDMLKNISAYMS